MECAKLFLRSNEDANLLNDADESGITPITAAQRNGNEEYVK